MSRDVCANTLPARGVPPLYVPALVPGRERDGTYLPVAPADVLYYFLARAAPLIRGAWTAPVRLRRDRVYLRTSSDLLQSCFRSLGDLADQLQDPRLVRVNKGVLAHLCHCRVINLRERQLGLAARSRRDAGELEWITISRRGLPLVRRQLALPRRRRSKDRSLVALDRLPHESSTPVRGRE